MSLVLNLFWILGILLLDVTRSKGKSEWESDMTEYGGWELASSIANVNEVQSLCTYQAVGDAFLTSKMLVSLAVAGR